MSTTLELPPMRQPEPQPPRNRRTPVIVVLAVLLVIATGAAVTLAVLGGGAEPAPGNPPSAGPIITGAPAAAQPTTASVTPTRTRSAAAVDGVDGPGGSKTVGSAAAGCPGRNLAMGSGLLLEEG